MASSTSCLSDFLSDCLFYNFCFYLFDKFCLYLTISHSRKNQNKPIRIISPSSLQLSTRLSTNFTSVGTRCESTIANFGYCYNVFNLKGRVLPPSLQSCQHHGIEKSEHGSLWTSKCDYNWELDFMTIFVTWQLRVTLDSICNSCDFYIVHCRRLPGWTSSRVPSQWTRAHSSSSWCTLVMYIG